MKIEDIIAMWQEDVNIDETELSRESLRTSQLHGKYLRHYSDARLKYRSLKFKQNQLRQKLTDYYRGDLNNPEDLAEIGREPYPHTRLKQEVSNYVDADQEMVNLNLKVVYQQELVEILEEIIKNLNTRGFQIKNAIDYLKFINGGY